MKKLQNIVNRSIFCISFFLFLLIWQISGNLGLLPKFILPTPIEIVKAFINDFSLIMYHSRITFIEAFVGLFFGVIIASALAIIMDLSKTFHKIVYPYAIITQTIPTVAIAPILVLWLGYGMEPKIVLVVITTVFPILISILNGFKNCDEDAIQFLKIMNASTLQILIHVKIPESLGYFFSGLKVSVSYALIGAVVSEWLGGFEGLGVYMTRVRKAFAYDSMFAVIVFISLLSLLLMKIVDVIQKYSIPWENIERKK